MLGIPLFHQHLSPLSFLDFASLVVNFSHDEIRNYDKNEGSHETVHEPNFVRCPRASMVAASGLLFPAQRVCRQGGYRPNRHGEDKKKIRSL